MRFTAPLALLFTFLTASAQAQSVAFPGPGMAHAAASITVTNIGVNNNTSGATLALTSVTVPASSLIIVGVCEYNSGTGGSGTVSDGVNTYTLIKAASPNSLHGTCSIYSAPSASLTSGTITYTKFLTGSVTAISAFYASNMVSQAADSAVSASATGNSTSPSVTSGTPAVAGELFVALCGQADVVGPVSTFTQDTAHGWTTPFVDSVAGTSPTASVDGGSQVNGSLSSLTFSPTLSSGGNWAAIVVGFKP